MSNTSNNNGPSLKLPEPKRFGGALNQVNNWLYGLELYFTASNLDYKNADKLRCAAILGSLLVGPAQQWHRRLSLTNKLPTDYEPLALLLKQQYGVVDEVRRARDQLKTIRQTKTVLEYITKFENVTMHIPLMSEEELVHSFIFGLKTPIKTQVLLQQPTTLNQAQTLATATEVVRGQEERPYIPPQAPLNNMKKRKWERNGNNNGNNEKKFRANQGSVTCYNCGKPGHIARFCNAPKKLGYNQMETAPKNVRPSTSH